MDFYIVLGIEREATASDIRRAYRRLARRLHPDINPGDGAAAAQFRQVSQAYETLIDPDRRRQYDVQGAGPPEPSAESIAFGFDGFDFSMSVTGSAAPTFGDLFGDVLQARAQDRTRQPERGADLHQSLRLGFEEALAGGRREITVTRRERCRTCGGTGRLAMPDAPCRHCAGAGAVRSVRGHMVFSKPCAACAGSGRRSDAACSACDGQQTIARTETIVVGLPPGLPDGGHLRISGKGHAGRNGEDAGDLILSVAVDPHPTFRREGDDLHLVVPLAIHEAALGARVDVPCPGGAVRLRIPPGTQSGQRFRLREQGAPSARNGRRGDLIVEVKLVLPPVLDERSKELLREFGRLNDSAGIRQTPDSRRS
jgi:molecular chaperone DnaJ